MSHTAIERSLEHVTMMPSEKRRWRTASQWWMSVLSISPVFTDHTRTVESDDPEMMMFSSYCRHSTDPVCPVRTCTQSSVFRSQI